MSIELNQYLYFLLAVLGLIISLTGIRYAKQWPIIIGAIVGFTVFEIVHVLKYYDISILVVYGIPISVGVVIALIFMFLPKLPYLILSSVLGGVISGLFGYCAIKDYSLAGYIMFVYIVTSNPDYGISIMHLLKYVILIMLIVAIVGIVVQIMYYVNHKNDAKEE